MDIKKNVGNRIRRIRKARHMTQEKLAEIIGVEPPSISNIENGKYFPSAENLEKIMIALNTSPEELFCTEENKNPQFIIEEINRMLSNNPDKLNDAYKVIKALTD